MKSFLYRQEILEAKIKALEKYGEGVTRRLLSKEINQEPEKWVDPFHFRDEYWFRNIDDWRECKVKPRYQVGDVAYFKEGIHRFNKEYASYDLDFTPVLFLQSANRFHWRWDRDKLSPMFLPYEAARHFVEVTEVTPERLDIKNLTPALKFLAGYEGKWIFRYCYKRVER